MHHGDWGYDWGFHWLGLVWVIATVLAAGGLVWFGATLLRRTQPATPATPPATPAPTAPATAARPTARDILDERLARGEIEIDDYRQRLAALSSPDTPDTPTRADPPGPLTPG